MLKNKNILLFLILVLFSCKSNLSVIETYKLDKKQERVPAGIVYNLPKTEIFINVEVQRIVSTKGPFEEYTQKYLGSLPNTISENKSSWIISDIEFQTIPVADTSKVYIIKNTKDFSYLPFNVSKEGFLISYNLNDVKYDISNTLIQRKKKRQNNFDNFSFSLVPSEKNYKVVYDTIYKEQVYDTIIRKIPVLKSSLIQKTREEQAKELADKLVLLRDDRAALLVGDGDNDNLPEGDALKLMLEQIDMLEAEYLSMFVGKIDTLKYFYSFRYIPTKNQIDSSIVLFKFSRNSGILPFDNIYGMPVTLELTTDNYTKKISEYLEDRDEYMKENQYKIKKGLYYRIPQKSRIQIKQKNQILAERTLFISQLGTVISLPENIFGNEDLKIEFYPELGSIKTIYY